MLEIKGVSKLYGDKQGCQSIHLNVMEQEICGVLGRNGSGKTTLFRCLLQLIPMDSGEVTLHGERLLLSDIGYVPEERSVIQDLRAWELVVFFAKLKNMKMADIYREMDYWFDKLEAQNIRNKRLKECSKGNQQKIQFICALIHKPKLLILDEPLTGLDVDNVELIKKIIYEHRKTGCIILLSSHQFEEIEHLCDRVLVLEHSIVKYSGRIKDIKDAHPLITITISDDPYRKHSDVEGVCKVISDGHYTKYVFREQKLAQKMFLSAVKIREYETMKVESLTLKDLLGDRYENID